MAFLNTLQALGEDSGQKQDIFGLAGPTGSGAPPAAGQGAGTGLTKTDVTSQMGTGGSTAGTQGPAPGSPAAAAPAFQKQVSQAAPPKDIAQATGSVRAAQQRQQEAANAFVKTSGQVQGFGDPEIEAAIGGKAEGSGVRSALSGQKRDVGTFQAPTEDISQAREFIDEQGRLSEAGLKKMFERQGGAEYTSGQSAYDAALARRNKGLKLQAQELAGAIRSQQETERGLGIRTTAEARAAAEGAEGQRTAALREALRGKSQTLTTAAARRQAEENAARAEIRRQGFMGSKDLQAKAAASREKILQARPELRDIITDQMASPESFARFGADVSLESQVTPEEATRYASILSLLGEKDPRTGGGPASQRMGFDTDAYETALINEALGAYDRIDRTPRIEIGGGGGGQTGAGTTATTTSQENEEALRGLTNTTGIPQVGQLAVNIDNPVPVPAGSGAGGNLQAYHPLSNITAPVPGTFQLPYVEPSPRTPREPEYAGGLDMEDRYFVENRGETPW